MKVLVTGAGGFLGSHLTRALLKRNIEVHTLGRNHYPQIDLAGVTQFQGDIRIKDDVRRALQGCEGVFHVAGHVGIWGDPKSFESINVEGTRTIIAEMKNLGIKHMVFTSSPSVVFGNSDLEGVDESTPYPAHYLAEYPRTKAEAEKLVMSSASADFKVVGLRPHLIYGREDQNLFPRVLARAREDKLRIIGHGKNKVDIIHIDNAVHAHLCAWDALLNGRDVSGKSYFVANEEPVYLWKFVNQVLELNNIRPVYKHVPLWFTYMLASIFELFYRAIGRYQAEPPLTRFQVLQMAKSHYFSHKKAQEELGYHPIVSFKDSLKELKFNL